jgi:LIVCS family branched-chain amino acid:cation transporter
LHGTHPVLAAAQPDQLIGAVSAAMLGREAGIIAVLAMTLACLTTAISLTIIFSEFLRKHLFANKLDYTWCVVITAGITFCVSLLGFSGIVKAILPIIMVLYPVFIVLSLLNIGHKLFGLQMVRLPLLLTFLLSLGIYLKPLL